MHKFGEICPIERQNLAHFLDVWQDMGITD
jgi:hypothetical protein